MKNSPGYGTSRLCAIKSQFFLLDKVACEDDVDLSKAENLFLRKMSNYGASRPCSTGVKFSHLQKRSTSAFVFLLTKKMFFLIKTSSHEDRPFCSIESVRVLL